MNTIRPIDTLWQDLRYAVRLLLRDKGFAVAAVLSLALGIGANTAIFQLLDAVRLRTLPVERAGGAGRGALRAGHAAQRQLHRPPADADLSAVRARSAQRQKVFAGMFAWSSGQFNTAAGGEVRRIEGLWASGEMFGVLGVKPVDRPLVHSAKTIDRGCGSPGAVISYAYWQREFGGAPSVLQQTVRLEGVAVPTSSA